MKIRTGLLLVLLSGSTLAAQPENVASSQNGASAINGSVRGAYSLERSRTGTAKTATDKTETRASGRQGYTLPVRSLRQDSFEFSTRTADLAEADQTCTFNQASYTYSCR